MKYHLAQLNIATLREPIDSPLLADFVAQLDEINALAEQSEGFLWRLKDEEGNATAIKVFDDEPIIINMSVWETAESLKAYVYNTAHSGVMKQRTKWFEKPTTPHLVLWWIPAGNIPTPQEAKEKLLYLTQHGETDHAFTFRHLFTKA
ncbi:MAG: DUF3291 domain-containing protein [Anaerolineae bacterium]|nr:DUF3291 domain-containing protein [Anaerolineae bacterium]